jgi:hypothetical protein
VLVERDIGRGDLQGFAEGGDGVVRGDHREVSRGASRRGSENCDSA